MSGGPARCVFSEGRLTDWKCSRLSGCKDGTPVPAVVELGDRKEIGGSPNAGGSTRLDMGHGQHWMAGRQDTAAREPADLVCGESNAWTDGRERSEGQRVPDSQEQEGPKNRGQGPGHDRRKGSRAQLETTAGTKGPRAGSAVGWMGTFRQPLRRSDSPASSWRNPEAQGRGTRELSGVNPRR